MRIRDNNSKTEYTVGRRRAEQLAERGGVDILDADGTDRLGRALDAGEATTKTKTTGKEQAR
ncbi:hypothetical protein [Micromonospora chersina]|uniref:hypothetical protein n=1 Tax=Micromonospora chersina TaxID=47854 RepID=UPI00371166FF